MNQRHPREQRTQSALEFEKGVQTVDTGKIYLPDISAKIVEIIFCSSIHISYAMRDCRIMFIANVALKCSFYPHVNTV